MTEREILQALQDNKPFRDLPDVRVSNLVAQPKVGERAVLDAKFDLQFGGSRVEVYAEVKSSCTPRQIEQIAPWLSQMRALRTEAAFALVCPVISRQAQYLCLERNVDFIDLVGNVSVKVPGKLLLRRIGLEGKSETGLAFYRNPFSGKSSRVLRVLLQKPKEWALMKVAEELAMESRRSEGYAVSFEVSPSLISRVLRSLEEELLVVRKGSAFLVPEPRRLLARWAEEYKGRHRWYLRRSFKCPNPFGIDLRSIQRGLDEIIGPRGYAFTGSAAAATVAPFVDLDTVDLYVTDESASPTIRGSIRGTSIGPDIRVIYPYDSGVFLYSSSRQDAPVVSDVQAYLDLFARGGRDLKQADYLLEKQMGLLWTSR